MADSYSSHSEHFPQQNMAGESREPTALFLRPPESITSPVPPLTPRLSRSRRSHISQHSSSGVNIPSWMSVNPAPITAVPQDPQRDTLTASPVSTVRPGLPDLDERATEYMTVDPDADFEFGGPVAPSAVILDDSPVKRRFVGGFVKRLRSLPRTMLKGATVINPFSERKPSKTGTTGTGDSLPKYKETAEPFLRTDSFGFGPSIEVFAPSDRVQYVQATPMPVANVIPEEENQEREHHPSPAHSHHGSIRAHPSYPKSNHHTPSASIYRQDGETTVIHQENHHTPSASIYRQDGETTVKHQENHHASSTSNHRQDGETPIIHQENLHAPSASTHRPDGETTIIPQEILPSTVAEMSPETVYPAPTSDYDRMEYRLRTPSEASFVTYLARIMQTCRDIYDLPWISTSRVVKDYVPAQAGRGRMRLHGTTRLKQMWYAEYEGKSRSVLDLLADPLPARKYRRKRNRDRTTSSVASSPMHMHTSHHPGPRRPTTARPRRRTNTGTTQQSFRSRRSSGVQTQTPRSSGASPRSSHSYAHPRSHRSHSPTYTRYPGGYASFNLAYAPPQPLFISPGPHPVPPGWPWSGTPSAQASPMPVFLLTASPTGALAAVPLQSPASAVPNSSPAQSNVGPPPSATAASS